MDHFTHPYLVDPFFGPSPHARFDSEGDPHSNFNTKLLLDSFGSLQDNIVATHPGFSQEDVYRLALIQFNALMVPRQVGSYLAEKRGDEEIPIEDAWDIRGDKLFHPQFGYFDEMIENSSTPEEAESLRRWQEVALHSKEGTELISFDLHVGHNGNFSIRYADIAVREHNHVRLKKRIDLVKEGVQLSLEEAWNRMQAMRSGSTVVLHKTGIQKVGILTVVPQNEDGERVARNLASTAPIYSMDRIFHNTIRDTRQVFGEMKRYLTDQHEVQEKQKGKVLLGELLTSQKKKEARMVLSVTPKELKGSKNESVIVQTWKKTAQTELRLSEGQSEKLLQEVIETHEVMTGAAKVMTFAGETKVALGAAFYALDVMAFNAPKQNEDAISVINEAAQPLVFEVPELDEPASEKRIDTTTRLQVVEFVRSIDALPVEKQIEKITEEKQKAIETIARVWEKATELVRSVDQTPEPVPEKQLSVAIAVWTILKLSNYLVALDRLEQMVRKLQGLEKPEGLVPREPAPWILLSIIWYLAQIREQGLVQTKAVPKKKKQKQSAPVIIYAFSS